MCFCRGWVDGVGGRGSVRPIPSMGSMRVSKRIDRDRSSALELGCRSLPPLLPTPFSPTSILFGPARPAGPILIALNPFKRLPLYTEGTLMTYFEQVGEAASLCWLVCVLGGYNEKCIISIYYCTRASQKVVSQHDHPHHTPARIPHTTPPPTNDQWPTIRACSAPRASRPRGPSRPTSTPSPTPPTAP